MGIVNIGDKDDLDLGLWCVLDIAILFYFFMFDVGEDFQNCDIGLCEGTGLGKGFSMMTRFVVERLTLVLAVQTGEWLNIAFIKKLQFKFK